jgi:hypothetical protein
MKGRMMWRRAHVFVRPRSLSDDSYQLRAVVLDADFPLLSTHGLHPHDRAAPFVRLPTNVLNMTRLAQRAALCPLYLPDV